MADDSNVMMPDVININGRCYRVLEENFIMDDEFEKGLEQLSIGINRSSNVIVIRYHLHMFVLVYCIPLVHS